MRFLYSLAAVANIGFMFLWICGRSQECQVSPDTSTVLLRSGRRKKKCTNVVQNETAMDTGKVVEKTGILDATNKIRNRKRSMPLTKNEMDASSTYSSISLLEICNGRDCGNGQEVPNAAEYQEPEGLEGIAPMMQERSRAHAQGVACYECGPIAAKIIHLEREVKELKKFHNTN